MSVVWSAEGTTQTFSSPRCADLSGDGVLDVVLGHGVTAVDPERRSAVGSVTAHDGKTGALLWRHQSAREIVGSAALTDLTGSPAVGVWPALAVAVVLWVVVTPRRRARPVPAGRWMNAPGPA